MSMAKVHYAVLTVWDDPENLQERLNDIAKEGGRVISVMWTPARTAKLWLKEPGVWESGYTIVWERE